MKKNKKTIVIALLGMFVIGTAPSVFAEAITNQRQTYDVKGAKNIAKQAVSLMEAGKNKEAYNFLLVYYPQYSEDNDILFLLGQTSQMMDKSAEAIQYYKKIIAKNVELPRVRLELGRAYAANGQRKEARKEFNIVLASSPPPVVAEHVKNFMAQMDSQKNVNIKATIGYIYDSNVNAGPDNTIINNGWQYNAIKKGDSGNTMGVQFDFLRQISGNSAWQTDFQYNRTNYRNSKELSWDEYNLSTGVVTRHNNVTYSLPLVMKYINVGGDGFSYTVGIAPQAQYNLGNNKELLVSVASQVQRYCTNSNRNGTMWSFNIAERFNFNKDKNGFLEVGFGYGNVGAQQSWYRNSNSNFYLTYYTPLPNKMWLLIRPSMSWLRYKGNDGYSELIGSPASRNERQFGLQVNLIKTIGTWNYILGYVDTRNHSNISIYNYNRKLISMQVAKYF